MEVANLKNKFMKTLSIKQTFAYLLCAGIKPIENRTWKLPEKYKGERILIHAIRKKMKPIKIITAALMCLYMTSCVPDYPVEQHDLVFLYADATERIVYMNDLTLDKEIAIIYSYTLFQIDFITILQIKGNPTFTFLYSNGCYYRN